MRTHNKGLSLRFSPIVCASSLDRRAVLKAPQLQLSKSNPGRFAVHSAVPPQENLEGSVSCEEEVSNFLFSFSCRIAFAKACIYRYICMYVCICIYIYIYIYIYNGVLGVELSWFRSYLCGRKICTTVDCDRVQSQFHQVSRRGQF